MDFRTTTIRELHEQLVSGTVTPESLLTESRLVIHQRDASIHAFIEVFNDQQETVDVTAGVLAGIPMAVKDNILYKGHIASAASKILENYQASYDATVVELLQQQHAVIVGRLNMDDSAMGTSTESSYYGITRNPLDETRC